MLMIQIINPGKVSGRSSYGGTVLDFNADGVAEVAQLNPGLDRWLRAAGYQVIDLADPAAAEQGAVMFDPGEHKVEDVLAYLADADEAERERVLAAEADGQARKSIVGKEKAE